MSERFPPQNNDNNPESNGSGNNEYDGWKARYDKFVEKIANGTATERDKRLAEEFKNKMDTHDDQLNRGVTENPSVTENVPHIDTTETNTDDSAESAEDYDDYLKHKKYEIMRSDEAQNAFMAGGEVAYIQYIEDAFRNIDTEFAPATPGTELEPYTGTTEPEEQLEIEAAPDKTKELELFKKSGELVPQDSKFEISEELANDVKVARERYAELTARDRKSYFVGRYTKDPRSITGKILYKIPGVRKLTGAIVDSINSRQESEIDDARLAYEKAVEAIQAAYVEYSIEQNTSPENIQIGRALIAGDEDLQFEGRVVAQRHEQSKDTNKFVDWWVSQDGFKGKLKKAGVVVAAGAVVGAAGAFAAPAALATAIGGAAGATVGGLIANHVTKRRANAKAYTRDAEGNKVSFNQTLAERQSAEDIAKKQAVVGSYSEQVLKGERQDGFAMSELTDVTEDRSDEEAFQNRSRMRKAIALGKLAGGLSGLGADWLTSDAHAATPTNPSAPKTPEVPDVPAAAPKPPVETLNGEHFTVESGSGYTKELMQFAQANGHNLSPSQAFQLHEHMVDKFGPDYINIQGTGGNDIYQQAGDFRLTKPGDAEWVKGVTQEAQKWMIGRGLW